MGNQAHPLVLVLSQDNTQTKQPEHLGQLLVFPGDIQIVSASPCQTAWLQRVRRALLQYPEDTDITVLSDHLVQRFNLMVEISAYQMEMSA